MAEVITAVEFKHRFLDKSKGSLTGCEVRGNVSLRGKEAPVSVRALNVTFWGEVDFSDCRFERSLDLSSCSFAKTLSLRNSRIEGSLDLDGIRIRTEGSATESAPPETRSLDLRGIQIGGDLTLSHAVVEYGTSPKKAKDRGGIAGNGARVGGRTELIGLKTDNSVIFSGSHFEGEWVFGDDTNYGMRDGSATISNALQMDNCHFGGNLVFNGGTVAQDLNLWASVCDGVMFIRPSRKPPTSMSGKLAAFTVHGNANLANVKFDYVDIEALHVSNRFQAFAAEFGQLRIHRGDSLVPSVFGRFELEGSEIAGQLDVSGINVTGDSHGGRAMGARIESVSVGGSMTFWSHLAPIDVDSGNRREQAPDADQLRVTINGDLVITGCRVGGDLNLTNVLCSGRIQLDDTRVTRDLLMRSTLTGRDLLERTGLYVSACERARMAQEQQENWEAQLSTLNRETPEDQRESDAYITELAKLGTRPLESKRPTLKTAAVAVSMNSLRCENEIDLTGLTLTSTEPRRPTSLTTLRSPPPGHVDAENIRVGRSLRLFEACDNPDLCSKSLTNGAGIVAPKAIDLSGATLGRIVLSHHSFDTPIAGQRAADVGIVLAGARIGEFTLVDLTLSTHSKDRLAMPRPLDLRDANVGQWNIQDKNKPLLSRLNTYLSLADSDDVFRRRTWLSLERTLRDRGHSADADKLFRRMERRDEAESWRDASNSGINKIWRLPLTFVSWLFFKKPFDGLLGYGTSPLRLLFGILIFWILALPLYLQPGNFEPSLEQLGAEETSYTFATKPKAEVQPVNWPTSAGLAYSLRHHLPVVALMPRDEWVLRDTGPACLGDGLLGSSYSLLAGSAESLSSFITGSSPSTISTGPVTKPTKSIASSCDGTIASITPENLGLITTLLNFIAWPFVLAFAINRFLRISRD